MRHFGGSHAIRQYRGPHLLDAFGQVLDGSRRREHLEHFAGGEQ